MRALRRRRQRALRAYVSLLLSLDRVPMDALYEEMTAPDVNKVLSFYLRPFLSAFAKDGFTRLCAILLQQNIKHVRTLCAIGEYVVANKAHRHLCVHLSSKSNEN